MHNKNERIISEFLALLGNDPRTTGIDHNNLQGSIDGIVLKPLKETNTWDGDRSSHQTHIAITGTEMNLFPPYTRTFPTVVDLSNNKRFKKDFVLQIPIQLLENNIVHLKSGITTFPLLSRTIDTYTHCAETIRSSGEVQVEISYKTLDGAEFIDFRSLLSTGDYIAILKKKNKFDYLCLGIRKTTFL